MVFEDYFDRVVRKSYQIHIKGYMLSYEGGNTLMKMKRNSYHGWLLTHGSTNSKEKPSIFQKLASLSIYIYYPKGVAHCVTLLG